MSVPHGLAQATQFIARDEAAIIDQLARMLAVDTCFPPGAGYADFATLIEDMIEPLGMQGRRVSVPESLWRGQALDDAYGERVNLIARADEYAGKPVCSLYFHVDTVPPGDGWSHPPLALTRADERLYGRGAADMKGTIVAVLAALRAAKACGLALRFDPVLLLCTDEEGGRYPGIRYLADQGLIEGHLLSFNGGAAPRIWAGCFGSLDMKIRVTGRAAHSGDPVGGINAIEESLPLLEALSALKRRVELRTSRMPAPPHYQGRPLHARLTLAAAHGGGKGSTLPAQFELLINRRYTPEERFEEVLDELHGVIDEAMAGSRALAVERELIGHLAPVSDPTGPHWPRWQAALCQGFGFAPGDFQRWGSSTSSDLGWVQRAGIQEMLLGGLARVDNRIHAFDEFTTLADIVALAQSVLLYLCAEFSPPEAAR